MTTNASFDDRLAAWLEEDSVHRVPDHLDEVIVQTRAMRQRAWWSSLERWLPVDTVAVGRPVNLRPLAIIAMVVGALLLTALAALWVASQQPSTFELASNGRIFVIDGQTLKSYAASGKDPQVALDLPSSDAIAPSFSPDGRSIAYILDTLPRLDILDIEDGTTTTIPLSGVVGVGGPISWSPDGTTVLFNTFDGQQEHIVTAKSDGTDVREIDTAHSLAAATSNCGPRGGRRPEIGSPSLPRTRAGATAPCTWSAPTALECSRSDPNGWGPIRSRGHLTPRRIVSSSPRAARSRSSTCRAKS